MLCLSGFELYSRWVPLNLRLFDDFYGQKKQIHLVFDNIYPEKYSHVPKTRLNMEKLAQMSDFIHNGGVITMAVKCTCI